MSIKKWMYNKKIFLKSECTKSCGVSIKWNVVLKWNELLIYIRNMDESWKHYEWKKSDIETQGA